MKAQYDNAPALMQKLQGGILINFNITQGITQSPTGDKAVFECDQVKVSENPNKGDIVSAIIRTRYSASDELALIHNGEDTKEHAEELVEFTSFRAFAKTTAELVLSAL